MISFLAQVFEINCHLREGNFGIRPMGHKNSERRVGSAVRSTTHADPGENGA